LAIERVERRLAAILAADVAGYSRLIGTDEEGTLARLRALRREPIDPGIAAHRGRIVKTTGDGLLVEFASVIDALRCAVEVQQAMAQHNAGVPAERRIEFRVGVHQGDIVVENGDIFGDGVNVAARLEALAEPGGICVSRRVQEDAAGRLDLIFEDLGEQQLKNISRPVQVFRVRPIPLSNPPPLAGEGEAGAAAARPELSLPDKPSLAVLPFQNMSGDPEQEYFADGIVEEITTAIARFPWLFVIARNSSFTYKGKAVDVRQVARELGVRYVLEGSVRKAGNRVRITGQLIDTTTAAHIWADRFDGTLDDIFELQDQIASSVAGAIEPKLRQSEIERASRKRTESLDAYDLYLRALAQVYKRTRESLTEALLLARRAHELDPGYAPAMALIAGCTVPQQARGWIAASGPEVDEGIRMARQAIVAAGDDHDVIDMAGYALAFLAGDNDAALAAIDRAIVLNPNSARALGHRALVLFFVNRPDEAIVAAQQAMRLSPLDPLAYIFYQAQANAHLIAGRYEAGLPWADRALRENAGAVALLTKLSLCGHLGRLEEASDCVSRLREVHPEPTIAGVLRGLSKGRIPEVVARQTEGWRKAGLPEG
jgi:adenylate cyclase